jgi:signal transduction histidine kinase
MEESAYMHRMTNSMLELAKLRNFTPIIAEVNIAELFSQIATSLEMTFQDYKVRLVTQPIDGSIQGQSDLIKSLITNLCMNAAKVCTADVGRVVLKVKLTKNKVEISVSDNGCGISKGHIDKLMEPFYQVDAARNKARGGVGLGLAIVKQIAEIHGAEIKIESEVGSGTEVTVIFNKSIITG